jgi:hypothetical protein
MLQMINKVPFNLGLYTNASKTETIPVDKNVMKGMFPCSDHDYTEQSLRVW